MDTVFQELKTLCESRIATLGLDSRFVKRLKWELGDIKGKNKAGYFLDLHKRKVRYPVNQNNLLVAKLLEIVEDFDIEKEPVCKFGESPDVDIDLIKEVRDYLKNIWAPKRYGADKVCNIGNYQTFGLKSALLDMARVHGLDHIEIQRLTKNISLKDDDQEPITWDAAMRLYPDLKAWCDVNKAAADAAKKLIGRTRGMSVHAGGVIISSIPIHDLVPLVKGKADEDNQDTQVSSWSEGLHTQDLQPVGLIKFDWLVIGNLIQVSEASQLVKERHGLKSLCALPGQGDWTDIDAWRDDPLALAMANKGDLKCIFQFDSEGIRKLVKEGGVTRFEDLAAFSSLFRPGPMACLSGTTKIKTKKGNKNIKELINWQDEIAYFNSKEIKSYTKKYVLHKGKKKKLLVIKTKSGKTIECSKEHKFLYSNGQFKEAKKLTKGDKIIVTTRAI